MPEVVLEESEKLDGTIVQTVRLEGGAEIVREYRGAVDNERDAAEVALADGMDGEARPLFSTDGEGYSVQVQIRNFDYLDGQTLPYIAPHAGGIGAEMVEVEERQNRQLQETIIWHNYYAYRATASNGERA